MKASTPGGHTREACQKLVKSAAITHMKPLPRIRLITITLAVILVGLAPPVKADREKPLTLEQQKDRVSREKVENLLEEAVVILNRQADVKKHQCILAIGDLTFCECITNKTATVIDFAQYVVILSSNNEDLKYVSMPPDTKIVVDDARRARDICVGEAQKTETILR